MKRGHIPHRMCVGCRNVKPKKRLIRLVSHKDGSVVLDGAQRLNGRGFYLCSLDQCVRKALKRHYLKTCLNRSSVLEEIGSLCGFQT